MIDYTLKAENLRKTFGSLVAVDNISVEISKGEIFGFLGPNGAGKTTSIKMITGLLKADSGNVFINNKLANEGDNRQHVGLCPQEIILWNNLTCKEQLVFIAAMYNVSNKIANSRANELLNMMGLQDKRNKLCKTLSGGMQRRMNILMALMHDPEILILDEPEAGLDPQSRVMVREFIHSLAASKTVIFTTHNMDEADRLCNRVGIIDHGKMLVTDTPENLKKQIGQGDKLEITVSAQDINIEPLKNIIENVQCTDNIIAFRSKAIVDRVPVILDTIRSMKLDIISMNLSENTLEDVFISLTGRKLRE
jgi:ABC-2 type transport system ATP-binding protein